MPEGGFAIKFDNKKTIRCYAITIDYDEWKYKVNNERAKHLPPRLKKITIKIEDK